MLLDYVEDVQDCEIIYEIVPFEISLPGDFCFTEESLCQMKGGEYPSASATYSGEDIRDNVVELKRTDFLECYDELSKGNEVPAIAMPLASLNEEGPSVVILVEGSRAETPIVLSRLESKERACSIADIAHYHGVENQESMTSSAVCMDVVTATEPCGIMSDLEETSIYFEKQKATRNMAIYRWQEKKNLHRITDKCGKSARQEATARRPRCNGRFNKMKAKWVVATEYFHPKLRRDKSCPL